MATRQSLLVWSTATFVALAVPAAEGAWPPDEPQQHKLKNWKEPLVAVLAGADRIEIRLVEERPAKVVAEIRGTAKIQELIKQIEINDAQRLSLHVRWGPSVAVL